MKVGEQVALFSHDGFRRFVTISETEVPSGIDQRTCYRTNEGSMFYMQNESGTGKHYNVGNRAFWIEQASMASAIANTKDLILRSTGLPEHLYTSTDPTDLANH